MQDEEVYDRVEAYVLGTMSAAELAAFERELSGDEELRDEVRARVAEAGRRHRSLPQSNHEGLDAGVRAEGAQIVSLRKWGTIAAGIAAALLIGFWALPPLTGSGFGSRDDFFEPAVGLPTTLGMAENLEFQDGMVSYKLGEYAEALARWSPLLELDPANDTLLFYSGVSLMALDSNARALATLGAVDEDYLTGRDYYLALLRYREGDEEGARTLLRGVAESESAYAERALRVLGELDDQ